VGLWSGVMGLLMSCGNSPSCPNIILPVWGGLWLLLLYPLSEMWQGRPGRKYQLYNYRSVWGFGSGSCSKIYPRYRPWRPIGLLDVKDPTLSRQSTHS
jgi:hypothetical protein